MVERTLASQTAISEAVSLVVAARASGLRDEVVVAIERAVLVGSIAPGQRLVEAEIARQMGISKAPVREALRELERLGLVVSYPRRGTFVADITPTVASEAFSLRAVIEAYAGRLAVARCSEDDIVQMEQLLAEADAVPLDEQSVFHRVELDLAFHDQLYRLSGHKILQEAWANLRAKIRVLLVATGVLRVTYVGSNEHVSYTRGHGPIVRALRARDPDCLDVAIVRHLAAGERMLLEHLNGDPCTLRVEAEAHAARPASGQLSQILRHVSSPTSSSNDRATEQRSS
jgi:DNA-binding GntR family transcriptional regulator